LLSYCHAVELTSVSPDTPAAQLTLTLGKLHCLSNEYLLTRQTIGEILAYYCFWARKKREEATTLAQGRICLAGI